MREAVSRAQRALGRCLVNGVIQWQTEPALNVAEYSARKLHEFKYAGKAQIGEESGSEGKIGKYSELFWR